MRFQATHNNSVILTVGITIVKKVLPMNEIQPKMVALHEGDCKWPIKMTYLEEMDRVGMAGNKLNSPPLRLRYEGVFGLTKCACAYEALFNPCVRACCRDAGRP